MLATKPYLTQADVQKILDAANKHAAANNWAVTIAVCDDGGHEEIINNGRTSFLSAPHISGMLEGGVNIEVNGFTIGAVGVSGVKSTEDAETAKAGIAAIL
jgi:uncharacterized protein GlcG (DUF336 family)